MPPALLFIACTATFCAHLFRLFHVLTSQRQWRRTTIAILAYAVLYGTLAWSYVGLAAGTRTADAHVALVYWIGVPLLVWPGILLVTITVNERRQVRQVLDEAQRIIDDRNR